MKLKNIGEYIDPVIAKPAALRAVMQHVHRKIYRSWIKKVQVRNWYKYNEIKSRRDDDFTRNELHVCVPLDLFPSSLSNLRLLWVHWNLFRMRWVYLGVYEVGVYCVNENSLIFL